jgi:hypothetical protein
MNGSSSWDHRQGSTSPSFGIVVHGVSTQIDIDAANIQEKIRYSDTRLKDVVVLRAVWLRRCMMGKRSSLLVIELEQPSHADSAIERGLCLGAELLACELYAKGCKLVQCFRCQTYGHIGKHCKAQETCGYCAGEHDTPM